MRPAINCIFFAMSMLAVGLAAGSYLSGTASQAFYWMAIGTVVGMQIASLVIGYFEHRHFMRQMDGLDERIKASVAQLESKLAQGALQ